MNYVKKDFIRDFLVFLPLGLLGELDEKVSFLKFLYLIKLRRMLQFFSVLDIKFYNPILRKIYEKKVEMIINDEKKEDMFEDHVALNIRILVSLWMKVFKIIV